MWQHALRASSKPQASHRRPALVAQATQIPPPLDLMQSPTAWQTQATLVTAPTLQHVPKASSKPQASHRRPALTVLLGSTRIKQRRLLTHAFHAWLASTRTKQVRLLTPVSTAQATQVPPPLDLMQSPTAWQTQATLVMAPMWQHALRASSKPQASHRRPALVAQATQIPPPLVTAPTLQHVPKAACTDCAAGTYK